MAIKSTKLINMKTSVGVKYTFCSQGDFYANAGITQDPPTLLFANVLSSNTATYVMAFPVYGTFTASTVVSHPIRPQYTKPKWTG